MDNILTEVIEELETLAKSEESRAKEIIQEYGSYEDTDGYERLAKAEGYRHVIEIIKAKMKPKDMYTANDLAVDVIKKISEQSDKEASYFLGLMTESIKLKPE